MQTIHNCRISGQIMDSHPNRTELAGAYESLLQLRRRRWVKALQVSFVRRDDAKQNVVTHETLQTKTAVIQRGCERRQRRQELS